MHLLEHVICIACIQNAFILIIWSIQKPRRVPPVLRREHVKWNRWPNVVSLPKGREVPSSPLIVDARCNLVILATDVDRLHRDDSNPRYIP